MSGIRAYIMRMLIQSLLCAPQVVLIVVSMEGPDHMLRFLQMLQSEVMLAIAVPHFQDKLEQWSAIGVCTHGAFVIKGAGATAAGDAAAAAGVVYRQIGWQPPLQVCPLFSSYVWPCTAGSYLTLLSHLLHEVAAGLLGLRAEGFFFG